MMMATLKGEAAPPNKDPLLEAGAGGLLSPHLSECLLLLPLSCMHTRLRRLQPSYEDSPQALLDCRAVPGTL